MRSKEKAIKHAINLSRCNGSRCYFVVYSPNENDVPGNDYHVANDFDLDT